MIGIVRAYDELDDFCKAILLLAAAYRVPLCSYPIATLCLQSDPPTVRADLFQNGCWTRETMEVPALNEFRFPNIPASHSPIMAELQLWLRENTIITDNKGVPKEAVTEILMRSPLCQYAIPTYRVTTYEDVLSISRLLPTAIMKPSNGRVGKGVCHLYRNNGVLMVEDRNGIRPLTEERWDEYLRYVEENRMVSVLLQPRLDFSLDEHHALDFRLLVSRGGTGDWETVIIYPRIGARHLVSNVGQGGYIGKTREILQSLFPEKAEELEQELHKIARELPPLLQSFREKTIACFGIDVGIDRGSMQPFVIEANSLPKTRFVWDLAQKKVEYFKYLLENTL